MAYYHTYLTILVPSILTFIATVVAIRFLMPYMRGAGITARDYNKQSRPVLPSGMGLALSFGFSIGILSYVFGSSFGVYAPLLSMAALFASIIALMLISLVGFLDDINVRASAVKTTGMMDTRVGLKQWQKPLLTFVGAIPLIAIDAGVSALHLPLVGLVGFGIVYPLVIIPLAVVFAANAFNLLGGFNGISTASGLVASLAMLAYSLIYGGYAGAVLAAVLSAALIGFALVDSYPAKIIPGDSFTYAVGAGLVITMIVGNMESFGIFVFMPWIIEFLLHLRGRFDVTDLGRRRSDGTFAAPYKRIYSWTHIIMKMRRCREWEVTLYMALITLGFVALGFAFKVFGLL